MHMDVTVEQVAVAGATLWTARQGTGPALVLCHGGPGLWDYLGPVADMVDDRATAYRYDQRACGRSSGGPPFDMTTCAGYHQHPLCRHSRRAFPNRLQYYRCCW